MRRFLAALSIPIKPGNSMKDLLRMMYGSYRNPKGISTVVEWLREQVNNSQVTIFHREATVPNQTGGYFITWYVTFTFQDGEDRIVVTMASPIGDEPIPTIMVEMKNVSYWTVEDVLITARQNRLISTDELIRRLSELPKEKEPHATASNQNCWDF